MDIIEKLIDLHKQAITERSHYYTAATVMEAVREIERLRLVAEAADMCMIELGALGEIDTNHPTVSALMNALYEL